MKIEFEWYFQTCANDTFDEKVGYEQIYGLNCLRDSDCGLGE